MPISPDENSNAPIPDLPEHWDFSGETHPVLFIHQMFCYIGSGCATLQTVWERSHTSAWGTLRRDVADRTQHINIVAGLLLTTIATFCTTQPPENSRLLPYTKTVPYCFLMVAMHLTIGGLIIGSTAVFIIHKASPVWFREVIMGSRYRIWITMTVLSVPSITVATSMLSFTLGLVIASLSSEVPFVRYGWHFAGLLSFLSGIGFIWIVCWRPGAFRLLLMRRAMC